MSQSTLVASQFACPDCGRPWMHHQFASVTMELRCPVDAFARLPKWDGTAPSHWVDSDGGRLERVKRWDENWPEPTEQ